MMYEIDKVKMKQAKYLMDQLSPLGGFIKEEVENKLLRLYPEEVVKIAKEYCDTGEAFLYVADKSKAAVNEIAFDFDDETKIISTTMYMDNRFKDWFTCQMMKAEAGLMKAVKEKDDIYPDFLNALEKKILYLFLEKKIELKSMAKQLECEDNSDYVVLLLRYIAGKLKIHKCELREMDRRLKEEELELDW